MHHPQFRPPARRGSGCGVVGALVAALVGLVGIAVAIIVVFVVSLSPTPKERAELNAAIEASIADAEAQERAGNAAMAAYELKMRKTCKVGDAAPFFVLPYEEQRDRCRVLVRENMHVPSSAEFPRDEQRNYVSDDGCNMILKMSVEGQNAFGVKVRTPFRCKLDPRTGDLSVKMLE